VVGETGLGKHELVQQILSRYSQSY
jgi:hypothetical protein